MHHFLPPMLSTCPGVLGLVACRRERRESSPYKFARARTHTRNIECAKFVWHKPGDQLETRLHAKFSIMQAAFLSFLCYVALQCTINLILLRYMLSLMEKMCRRREGTKTSRSRVANFVSKTYSRVALVDQTGPIMVAPLEWRSCRQL